MSHGWRAKLTVLGSSVGFPDRRRITSPGTNAIDGMNGEGTGAGFRTKKPPSFVKRGKDWRAKGLSEDRLRPTINRIIRLAAARLTIEKEGADFLRCRIALL